MTQTRVARSAYLTALSAAGLAASYQFVASWPAPLL